MFKSSSRRSRDHSRDVSALNAAITLIDTAKDAVEILPVKGVFASVSVVLTLVRVSQDLHEPITSDAAK